MNVEEIRRYLDREGRVRVYPSKQKMKRQVLAYLASKFEPGREYTEREVNDVLRRHHTFEDWALLRRDLFDNNLLDRATDGARYWRAGGLPQGRAPADHFRSSHLPERRGCGRQ